MAAISDALPARARAGLVRTLALGLLLASLGACTTILARNAIPQADIDSAMPYGIDTGTVRVWGDEIKQDEVDNIVRRRALALGKLHAAQIARGEPIKETVLALSGGGADGAFGAGLLKGWSDRGDRPEFTVVTGISTGAVLAVFAFLGPDYDDEMEEVYTTYKTDQLITRTIFSALTGGSAFTDTRRYRGLIEKYVDAEVIARIAEGHRQGRVLMIGTTNLDASRPVIWNISGIAASGHPDAPRLIHDVIQASSAIPAAFPPVLIPVETPDGKKYDEMHVDGGATQQVMFISPQVPMLEIDQGVGAHFDRTMYVVINNSLQKPYEPVRPRVLSIAEKAASSLIGGSGSGDIYKIFAIAERDHIDLNVIAIPPTWNMEASEPFDPVYMKALFDLGAEYGRAGDRWLPRPRDFAPWPPDPAVTASTN